MHKQKDFCPDEKVFLLYLVEDFSINISADPRFYTRLNFGPLCI